jgi:hypothetical protein
MPIAQSSKLGSKVCGLLSRRMGSRVSREVIRLRALEIEGLANSATCGVCGKPLDAHLNAIGKWMHCYRG